MNNASDVCEALFPHSPFHVCMNSSGWGIVKNKWFKVAGIPAADTLHEAKEI